MNLLDSLKDWFGVSVQDIIALVLPQGQDFRDRKAILIRDKKQIKDILTKYSHYDGCSKPAMWVYTKEHVYGISVYDCATSWFRIPRNPDTSVVPEFIGGY